MYNKCCVVSCASGRKDVSFHKFPKTEIGLRKWLECLNCERLRSLSFKDLQKQFVCRRHFEKRFLASSRVKSRLRSDAYPSLFTTTEMSSGIPETSPALPEVCQEHDYMIKRQHCDHTYYKAEIVAKRSKTESEIIVELPASLNVEMHNVSGPSHTEPTEITTDNVSTPKSRRRIICTKNKRSPHCARLRKLYRQSQRQLSYFQRARKAVLFSETKFFEKITNKMNPLAKQFIWMQIKQYTKKARGRRFSDEEKLIALSIMKQSPKCYRFLHKIFILPSKYTLNKMIANLNVEAGINSHIINIKPS